MGLKKLAEKCQVCPFVDKCSNKRMEALGYLEPVTMSASTSMVQPILRETMTINIDGHLTKVYKDDIEKELYKSLYSSLYSGLQIGG